MNFLKLVLLFAMVALLCVEAVPRHARRKDQRKNAGEMKAANTQVAVDDVQVHIDNEFDIQGQDSDDQSADPEESTDHAARGLKAQTAAGKSSRTTVVDVAEDTLNQLFRPEHQSSRKIRQFHGSATQQRKGKELRAGENDGINVAYRVA